MENTIAIIYIGEKRIYDNIEHHNKLFKNLEINNIKFKIYQHFKRNNKWPNTSIGNNCNQVENLYDCIENISEKYIMKLRLDTWFCDSSYKIIVENIKHLFKGDRKWIKLGNPCDCMLDFFNGLDYDFFYLKLLPHYLT